MVSAPSISIGALLLVGCGTDANSDAELDEIVTEPTADQAPTPAPEPAPLMRRPIHCCSDLALEPVMSAYLELGAALASGDAGAAAAPRLLLIEKIADADLAALEPALAAANAMDGCAMDACRTSYREMSEMLVDYTKESHGGDLDLAVAYSRDHDAHWIQDGVEIRSPYGDNVNSFSWGTREAVQTFDREHDAERAASGEQVPRSKQAPKIAGGGPTEGDGS